MDFLLYNIKGSSRDVTVYEVAPVFINGQPQDGVGQDAQDRNSVTAKLKFEIAKLSFCKAQENLKMAITNF